MQMVKTKEKEKSAVEKTLGGFFKARGVVTRIVDNGGQGDTFKHSVINNGGKYDGSPMIQANLNLTTNSVDGVRNDIDLRMFAMKTDTLYAYDNSAKETIQIPYEEWEDYLEVKDEDERNRYNIFNSIRLKVEQEQIVDESGEPILDEDGFPTYKTIDEVRTYPTYDALEILEEVLERGTGLFVKGRMEFRMGEDRQGNPILYKSLNPSAIYAADVNFEKEDFEEVNDWNQQFYVIKATNDTKTQKVTVLGRIVDKNLDWVDVPVVVPYGAVPELAEFAEGLVDELEYGDLVYLGGYFRRGAKSVKKKSKIAGGKSHVASTGFGELEYVTDGTYTDAKCEDDLQKHKVTKRDFEAIRQAKEAEVEEKSEEKNKSSFSRSSKATKKVEEDDTIDIDDDDLPF